MANAEYRRKYFWCLHQASGLCLRTYQTITAEITDAGQSRSGACLTRFISPGTLSHQLGSWSHSVTQSYQYTPDNTICCIRDRCFLCKAAIQCLYGLATHAVNDPQYSVTSHLSDRQRRDNNGTSIYRHGLLLNALFMSNYKCMP